MSCGKCGVTMCVHCGKLFPQQSLVCTVCGKERPTKTCPYCGHKYFGYTGDPPVCPRCSRDLPPEFL